MREYIVSETLPKAYRTFMEALEAIKRDEKDFLKNEAVRVVIQGTQHLTQPQQITAELLPGAEHPVIVEGADRKSGFSGGMRIEEFSHWKDNIWRTKVPQVQYTRHLYIDGRSAKRPITPYRKPLKWETLESEDYVLVENSQGEEGISTTHTEIAGWKNIRDLEMVFEVGWVHCVIPIECVEVLAEDKIFIKPLEPAYHSARTMGGVQIGGTPNYIENVFELLGKPLEWYFDRTEQMLYIGFEEGDNPENHEIIIPMVEQLIEVKGELDVKPCHLCFKNLHFMHTTWLSPQKYGVPEIQANQMNFSTIPEGMVLEKPYEADYQKVIAALRILAAKDVSFENCTFTALGTGALQYEFGAQDCRIIGNHFYEIGGSAVSMGDFWQERGHHPQDRREIVRGIEIKNNYIHDTGKDFKGSAAVIGGYVQDITVSHNEICNVPYSAVSLGWGWGTTDVSVGPMRETPWKEPSVCMRNRVMYNHLHHCMQELHDGAAVYTLGCMTGTAIIGNYIHESAGFRGEGFDDLFIIGRNVEEVYNPAGESFWAFHGIPGGIYLDEGSQGIEICDNVLHDIAIPLLYHNQIDKGYRKVWFRDNVLNKKPGNEGFPVEIAECSGLEPLYRYLME